MILSRPKWAQNQSKIDQKTPKIIGKNSEIDISTIQNVLSGISPLSIQKRITELGLRPDRADVILHAGKIYESIMRWSQCKEMIVPQSGLPDGIIHELYDSYINTKI